MAEPPPTPKPAEAKEVEAQAGDIDSTSPDTPSYELGKKVEVWQSHHGKWFLATVLRTSNAGKVMVKFDLYPNDKYDKWFEVTSSHIRLPATPAPSPTVAAPASAPATETEKKTPSKEDKIKAEIKSPVAAGGPSGLSPDSTDSAAAVAAAADSNAVLEEMSKTFRKLLLYFVPPGFSIPAETIQTLSHKELSQFPIDDFIAKYNNKLGMMIEEQLKEGKSDITQKLSHNRRLVGRLLRLVHEDSGAGWNLAEDDDSDDVDRHLELVVQSSSSTQLG